MSLTTILEQIKKLEVHAKEDVENNPNLSTLAGRRGRKRQAIEDILRLKEDYIKEISKNAVFIVATGSGKDELGSIAKNEYFSFSVNPETLYSELADRVPAQLYMSKGGSPDLFDVLGRHIEDKASELNLAEYNYVMFKANYAKPLKTREDLAQLIKLAVNEQIGTEIVGIHALRHIAKEAIEREHKGVATTIVLPTDDEVFVKDLSTSLKRLTKRVHVVSAGKTTKTSKTIPGIVHLKDVNNETVKQYLLSLKK